MTYSLVGIGLLIASDERLFTALKYIAASYFCYIAWYCLRAQKPDEPNVAPNKVTNETANQMTKDGSTINNIQAVVDFENLDEALLKKITTAASVAVSGKLVASQGAGQATRGERRLSEGQSHPTIISNSRREAGKREKEV